MKVEIKITELLEKREQKLAWLSRKTWINYNALSRIKKWETAKISFETIWKLIEVFKCSPNDLFKITK
jgi:DNA-binding Xre family transcriptional regulator